MICKEKKKRMKERKTGRIEREETKYKQRKENWDKATKLNKKNDHR